MAAEHHKLIPELFAQALEVDAAHRDAWLRERCADNHELLRAVNSLLRHNDETDDFLAQPAINEAAEIIAPPPASAIIPQQLGRFHILAPIGQGGMGEVFRARDDLDREVAIKLLPALFAQQPERVARFEREAKTLAQLNHPNIAAIYGREQIGEQRFLVLEYVQGETLSARLSRGKPELNETLLLFRQIADALQTTHEAGIVHRDLKPANIMLTPRDQVKLLDFGIAKHFRRDLEPTVLSPQFNGANSNEHTLTQPGITPGTIAYMSPEQCSGNPLGDDHDARAIDLWAFGLVLYESLTGLHPFKGKTSNETRTAICHRDPDWRALPSDTPAKLHRLLRDCLEKDSTRRLSDAGEAKRVLDGLLAPSATSLVREWWRQLGVAGKVAVSVFTLTIVGWLVTNQFLNRRDAVNSNKPLRLAVVAWNDADEAKACAAGRSNALARTIEARLRDIRGLHIVTNPPTANAFDLLAADLTLPLIAQTQGADTVLKIAASCQTGQPGIRYALVNRRGETLTDGNEGDYSRVLLSVLNALKFKTDAATQPPDDRELRYYEARVALDQYASEPAIDAAITTLEELQRAENLNATYLNQASIPGALGLAYQEKWNLTGKREYRDKAVNSCEQARNANIQSPLQLMDARLSCARVLIALENYDQAVSELEAVLQSRPDDADAVLALAEAYERKKEDHKAEQLYQQAIALRPDYWGGYNEFAALRFNQDRYAEAAELWQKVVDLLPFNAYAYSNLASALMYDGQLDLAVNWYQKAVYQQKNAEAYFNLGVATLFQGNCDAAAAAFAEAVKLRPEDGEMHGWLAEAYQCVSQPGASQLESSAASEYAEAIELLKADLRADPGDHYRQSLLIEWSARLGRRQNAVETIQQILKKRPGCAACQVRAIKLYHQLNRRDQALKLARQLVTDPRSWFELQRFPDLQQLRDDPAWQMVSDAGQTKQEN